MEPGDLGDYLSDLYVLDTSAPPRSSSIISVNDRPIPRNVIASMRLNPLRKSPFVEIMKDGLTGT